MIAGGFHPVLPPSFCEKVATLNLWTQGSGKRSTSRDDDLPRLCAANARCPLFGPWPACNARIMFCWKTADLLKNTDPAATRLPQLKRKNMVGNGIFLEFGSALTKVGSLLGSSSSSAGLVTCVKFVPTRCALICTSGSESANFEQSQTNLSNTTIFAQSALSKVKSWVLSCFI